MNNPPTGIRFLRVLGVRSRNPSVIAAVDGNLVRWDPRGWSCGCDTWALAENVDTCDHVEVVAAMLDQRVLGDAG